MSDPIYSAEQIRIPPELPEILKNYAKHIIKTQPSDVLAASAEYFARISKQRVQANNGKRLTNRQLEAFFNKFGGAASKSTATRKEIEEASILANIPQTQVGDVLTLGGWTGDRIPWLKFWALLCASAAGSFLSTLELVAEIAGDNGKVSVPLVQDVFHALVEVDKSIDQSGIVAVNSLLNSLSGKDYSSEALLQMIQKEFNNTHVKSEATHAVPADPNPAPVASQPEEPMTEEQPVPAEQE